MIPGNTAKEFYTNRQIGRMKPEQHINIYHNFV
jgi:hypothetical protein